MAKSADAFRTISEVAEWLEIQPHVLRFWESKFSQIKPTKRAGGRRYYRPKDMLFIGGLKKLLHEDGMTIKGAQKLIREHGIGHVAALSQPLEDGLDAAVTLDDAPDNIHDDVQEKTLSNVIPAPIATIEHNEPVTAPTPTVVQIADKAPKRDKVINADQYDLFGAPQLDDGDVIEPSDQPDNFWASPTVEPKFESLSAALDDTDLVREKLAKTGTALIAEFRAILDRRT